MTLGRRTGSEESKTRGALLDAAQELMLEEGYAAVSSRRLSKKAGVNARLVYYYFQTMDDLLIALFRRSSQRSYERQVEALSGHQPLWALWEVTHDHSNTALNMEFIALANHRKAIRAEIARASRRFRRRQLEAVTEIFGRYGVPPDVFTPETFVLLLASVSRFLLMEDAFGIHAGHAEMVALVEQHLRRLEGERRPTGPGPANGQSADTPVLSATPAPSA